MITKKKFLSIFSLLLMVTMVFTLLLTIDGSQVNAEEPGVYLYENVNYEGRLLYDDFRGIYDLPGPGLEKVRSLKIVGDYAVVLTDYGIFSNTVQSFYADKDDLVDTNIGYTADKIEVYELPAYGEGVYLYENTNYDGKMLRFGPGSYNLDEDFGFDDQLSSLKIVGGYDVTLYQDDWSDTEETFYNDDPDLSDNVVGDNKVSTIIVRENKSDWMEQLSKDNPLFQKQKLWEVLLPGTHDSGTSTFDDETWLLAPDNRSVNISDPNDISRFFAANFGQNEIANLTQTQSLTVEEQLFAGARYLDLRVGPFMVWEEDRDNCFIVDPVTGEVICNKEFLKFPTDLRTMHGLYGEKVEDILNGVQNFVTRHPKEIVILDFQHFHEMKPESYDHLVSLLDSKFSNQLITRNELQTNTLEDLWSNGKNIVVLFGEDHHYNNINPSVTISNYIDNTKVLKRSTSLVSPWPNTDDISELREKIYSNLEDARDEKLFVSQMVMTPTTPSISENIYMNFDCLFYGDDNCKNLHNDYAVPANNLVMEEVNNGFLKDPRTNIIMLNYFDETTIVDDIIKENNSLILKPTNTQMELEDDLIISWENPDVSKYFGELSNSENNNLGLPYFKVFVYKDGENIGASDVGGTTYTYTDLDHDENYHKYQLKLVVMANQSGGTVLYDSGFIDVLDSDQLQFTNIGMRRTSGSHLELSWEVPSEKMDNYFIDLNDSLFNDGALRYRVELYKDNVRLESFLKGPKMTYMDIDYDGDYHKYQLRLIVEDNYVESIILYDSDFIDVLDSDQLLDIDVGPTATNLNAEVVEGGIQLTWDHAEIIEAYFPGKEFNYEIYRDGEYVSQTNPGSNSNILEVNLFEMAEPHEYSLRLMVYENYDDRRTTIFDGAHSAAVTVPSLNLKPTNIQTEVVDNGLLMSWDNPDVSRYFGPLSDTDHEGDGLPYYFVYAYKDGEYMGLSEISGTTYMDENYDGKPHNYQLRLYVKANWDNVLYDSGLIDVVDMDQLQLTNTQTKLTDLGLQLSWNNPESAIKNYFGDELASEDHEDGFTPYYVVYVYRDGEHIGISDVSGGTTYTDINYDGQPHNYQLRLYVKANWDNVIYDSGLIDVVEMDQLQLTNTQTKLTDSGLQLSWNNPESAIKNYFGDELASEDHEDGFTPYYVVYVYRDGEHIGISDVSGGTTYTDINYDGQPHNYQLRLYVKANWNNFLYDSGFIDVVDSDQLELKHVQTEVIDSGLQLSWTNPESAIKNYFGDELASEDHEDGFTPYYVVYVYRDGEHIGISDISGGSTYEDKNYDGQPHSYQLRLYVKANWTNFLYDSGLIMVSDPQS
ncbi:hypothetical protein [Chengkuizengella sediminis]|uniref:hypothetical protein n=1 Tax=Chengkuizengella sediminis TaxID=1885917 RepID=UPI001389AD91|nr:hypothetical protein [Chengkuizengella sediminis]NDI36293.1 hypothetical protein [Chengkuizengella sediminis]